ncbi:MAG: prolipoprotein diacylglyceryl transferase [Clostridia bacterium]|nr:prolipoprotein diacylglyceryl transferase [Clostridia bacterium]
MILSTYGLCLLGACALGFALMAWLYSREGVSAKAVGVFAPLALALGWLGARMYALLFSVAGACPAGPLFSAEPVHYAAGGAVLGVALACLLASRVTKQPLGELADALAPAGMLTMALARCSEVFADFGGSAAIENGPTFFPLAVQYGDGTWHMSVFFLEALFAFAALAYALNMRTSKPGERFVLTFVFWSMTQVLCESFREYTVNLGFIGVQQLQYIVMAVAILAIYARILAAKPYYKKELPELLCWVTTIECAAFVVMLEYAIAYWVLPAALDYLIMAMALCGIFLSVRLIVRRALRNEDVPWKDR